MKNWKYVQVGNGIREAVGNRYSISVTNPFKDAHRYGEELAKNDYNKFKFSSDSELERIWRENTSGQDYELAAFSDFKKGYNQQYMKMDRTGNSKFGNDATADKLGLRPVIEGMEKDIYEIYKKNGQNREKTKRELIEKHNFSERQAEETMRKLVGNESIYKQEASMFGGLGKKAEKEIGNESQDLEKMARLRQLVSGDIIKTKDGKVEIEKYDEIGFIGRDGKRYTWSEVKAYNSKTGNARYGSDEDMLSHIDTDLYEIHQRLKQKDESPWRYLSELQKKGYDMGTLSRHNKEIGKIIEKLKTGNETKAEEKFGKVMGEFEEGALKTPQGKTVTDPAQAKAIAYSEADKVDNLKRARNAMKTKNRKAIGTHFDMNDYGIDVGPWSWDWKGQVPDKKTMQEIARKIKDYARQIDKDVPEGDSDERDEVFAKLDRFMQTQGLK